MKAVILNSGIGKRLGELSNGRHKSMLLLKNGETVFARQLRILAECGVTEAVVTTGPYEEQLREEEARSPLAGHITFIRNTDYATTNYIYSLYLARTCLDDDVVLLHGDLVFDKAFVKAILDAPDPCLAAVNKAVPLPDKDFKAKLGMRNIEQISVNILGVGCFAFQPFYKLSKAAMDAWMARIAVFVERGDTGCYAENALNELLDEICLEPFDYEPYFVEEIDTPEDYKRVSEGIRQKDYVEQPILVKQSGILEIKSILDDWGVKKPLLVCGHSYDKLPVRHVLEHYGITPVTYQGFTPNPTYEQAKEGTALFLREGCDGILSVGGGSAMDVAKAIKLFAALDQSKDYLQQELCYSPYKHLAVPTTAGTGSESTRYAVIYCDGEKHSLTHDCILPDAAILDANLLRALPDEPRKASFCDALCHCIEALWSVNATEVSDGYAKSALNLLLRNRAAYFSGSMSAACKMLEAANLAGKAINISQTTAAHAMCYKLTTLYGIPHGYATALCLPAVWEHLARSVHKTKTLESKLRILSDIFQSQDANDNIQSFRRMIVELGIPIQEYCDRLCMNRAHISDSVNKDRLKNCPIDMNRYDIGEAYDRAFDAENWSATNDLPVICVAKRKPKKQRLLRRILNKNISLIKSVLKHIPPAYSAAKFLYKRLLFLWYRIRYSVNRNLVVLDSFQGAGYRGNPRAIYETMLKDDAYGSFSFVWALNRPAKYAELEGHPHTKVVRYNSRQHMKALATAGYIVSNVRLPRFACVRKNQVYIQTWHGKPIKRIGCDVGFKAKGGRGSAENRRVFTRDARQMSYLLSPAPFFSPHLASAYNLEALGKTHIIYKAGYARNDFLFRYTDEDVLRCKLNLGIPVGKKVILYAPTWRPTRYEKGIGYIYDSNRIDFTRLSRELGDDCVLLFRAHINEAKSVDFSALSGFVMDMTEVEDVNDLYIVSDLMISDYSGTIFDYANTKKPMVFFQYDRYEYVNELTGTYVDLDELPGPVAMDQNSLTSAIKKQLSDFSYDEKYQAFNDKYNCLDGPDNTARTIAALMPPSTIQSAHEGRQQLHRKSVKNAYVRVRGLLQTVGMCDRSNGKKLAGFQNIHADAKRCFLIGNGPSLSLYDLDALKDEVCFSCNLIYKIFDRTRWRPTYHCITDSIFTSTVMHEIGKSIRIPLFTNQTAYRKIKKPDDNVIFAYATASDPYYVHGNMRSYYVSSVATVMTFMIELAMYMGFREIYLVGVDCSNGFTAGGHFIKEYETKEMMQMEHKRAGNAIKGKILKMDEFGKWRTDRAMFAYAQLRKYADAHGIKICNATRGGYLEEFERVDLDALLATISKENACKESPSAEA